MLLCYWRIEGKKHQDYKRDAVETLIRCISTDGEQIHFRSKGYKIDTCAVGSACKHVFSAGVSSNQDWSIAEMVHQWYWLRVLTG